MDSEPNIRNKLARGKVYSGVPGPMLRGYRCVIVAAFGLALMGADKSPIAPQGVSSAQAAAQGKTDSKATKAAPHADVAPEAPEAKSADTGCADRKDRRDSDLCAQWKAADAAFDSARAAERQTIIGWIGLLLGSITMAAAIAAAMYAKRAAIATEATVGIATDAATGAAEALNIAARNADAAQEQVEVAQMTAKRQLRAYVSITDTEIAPHMLNCVTATAKFINNGETPAINLQARLWISILPGNNFFPLQLIEHPVGETDSRAILGKGGENQIIHITEILQGLTSHEIFNGEYVVIAYGWITYDDIFGTPQETRFCSYQSAATRASGLPIVAAPIHNSMT